VEAASEKQASDIALMDVKDICSFADYFIICSGENERHIQAICDIVEDALESDGFKPHHIEGNIRSGWILLDYGDLIVHIFAPFERDFYQLEQLWSQARLLVKMQ